MQRSNGNDAGQQLKRQGTSPPVRRPREEAARDAYARNNREESRLAHSSPSAAVPAICERGHKSHAFPTELRKGAGVAIQAGTQGVLFCCIVAAGLESLQSNPNPQLTFSVCLTGLLGFALALGFLDYANKQAEKTFGETERAREKWECENYLEGEQKEMVELYVNKGLKREDAETAIALLSKNQELFIDIMMAEELGIAPYNGLHPRLSGLMTAVGFILFGALPLLAYSSYLRVLQGLMSPYALPGEQLAVLLALAIVVMFLMGVIKNFYCIDLEAWWLQGLQMTALLVVAVVASFGLGTIAQSASSHSILYHS